MTEVLCEGCRKIVAYLAIGSRIANGSVTYCHKCKQQPKTVYDMPDFLAGLMGKKK